jgi:geranylgeranyl reductase family protein
MPSNRFDVLIVGGGPAGSLTAYFLAKAGVRTLLLDASTFPRLKPCGGGLQARALTGIPIDLSHLLRGVLNGIHLSFRLRDTVKRAYPEPLVYNILRTEFDHFLLQCASDAGTRVYQGTPVRMIEVSDGRRIGVRCDREEFRAECLVGADGANSLVRASLGSRHDFFWQAAMSCELPEEAVNYNAIPAKSMIIDWGSLPSGYAWAFPKHGSVNVGAGAPIAIAKHLRRYVRNFLDSLNLLKNGFADRLKLVGHQLPTLTSTSKVAAKRVLLVGDAAGLVEPFTGDGISFACHSARIAAQCIFKALNSTDPDLTGYGARLRSEIGNELIWSRKLVSVSTNFPRLIYRLFRTNDRVWNTFCRTLRGEESFHRLKKDVLGPFEFAWALIDKLTQLREPAILRAKSASLHIQPAVGISLEEPLVENQLV